MHGHHQVLALVYEMRTRALAELISLSIKAKSWSTFFTHQEDIVATFSGSGRIPSKMPNRKGRYFCILLTSEFLTWMMKHVDNYKLFSGCPYKLLALYLPMPKHTAALPSAQYTTIHYCRWHWEFLPLSVLGFHHLMSQALFPSGDGSMPCVLQISSH